MHIAVPPWWQPYLPRAPGRADAWTDLRISSAKASLNLPPLDLLLPLSKSLIRGRGGPASPDIATWGPAKMRRWGLLNQIFLFLPPHPRCFPQERDESAGG